jgi:hypothetical protein
MSATIITEFLGKTLQEVYVNEEEDYIIFTFDNGTRYEMYHKEDCCKGVYIEDIEGDLGNLIGYPLTMAEEVSEKDPEAEESGTWTFYKFATIKGYVTVRWYVSSNGYYSEEVSLVKKGERGRIL